MIIKNVKMASQRLTLFGLPIVWLGVCFGVSLFIALLLSNFIGVILGSMFFLVLLGLLLFVVKLVFIKDLYMDKKLFMRVTYRKEIFLEK